MSRLATLLLAIVLAAAGLVGVAGPASADCPYTGCIHTTTQISAPSTVKKGAKVTVRVRVSVAGNAAPEGKVTVSVTGKGVSFSKTVSYGGSRVSVSSPALKKAGKYKITAMFSPAPDTVWRSSRATDTVKVK